MSRKEAQFRFAECQDTLKGASSNVGFLGADRPAITNLKFWKYVCAIVLIGAILANTQIG